MTPPATRGVSHATLLAEMSWMRRLAHELVGESDLADDLVQEACVVALEQAPREGGKLRQWLATVLRNALRQRLRSGGRRAVREQLGARPEAQEATDRLVERVTLQRLLAGAVLELEEPYRSTVLLRFFEDLPPREIARRAGVPVATVMSRLQRAMARLRERLDREHRSWSGCLVPWIRELTPASPSLISTLMNTKMTVAVAGAVLAGAFLLWQDTGGSQGADAPPAGAGAARLSAPDPGSPTPAVASTPQPGSSQRRPATTLAARPETALPEAPAWTVQLRVLDAEARPLPGLAVRAADGPGVLGTSGNGGWCVFQTRAGRLVLGAADERWVTIHEGVAERQGTYDPVLVVAPALALSGRVADIDGRGLAGARVRVELPRDFDARFDEVLDATRPRFWLKASEAGGGFDLGPVPEVQGAVVRATLAGYRHTPVALPLGTAAELELLLERPEVPASGALRGRVVDLVGNAVPGARVGLGLASVPCDERGEFQIDLARAVTTEQLTAVQAGFLPAVLERPGEPGPRDSGWPEYVQLVLGQPALAIRGRVVDPDGRAVSGARLWLADPTPAAPIGIVPVTLENLIAGASIPAQALESEARMPERDGDDFWDVVRREPDSPSALWNFVTTDAAGDFELPGLDDRRYRLNLLGPDSLALTISEAIPAGSSGVLVPLDPSDVYEELEGRVVGGDRQPVEGVAVTLQRPLIDVRARVFGGSSQMVLKRSGGTVRSDAEGRFRFTGVPRSGATLVCSSDDILPCQQAVESGAPRIVVERRCHLQVVLGPARADCAAFSVTAEDGTPLDLMSLTEGGVQALTDMPLLEGRSAVVAVSERARRLVLWKDDAIVGEFPIFLVAGEVNRVTP